MSVLDQINYSRWIKTPQQVYATQHTFVLSSRAAIHGHLLLLQNLSRLVGLKQPNYTHGLQLARAVHDSGEALVYMALTNDHLPATHKDHNTALKWERSAEFATAPGQLAIFIGYPGRFIHEGPRKEQFCELSEKLVKESANPFARFTLPCATQQHGLEAYKQVLTRSVPLIKFSSASQPKAGPVRFISRVVKTNKVLAFGGGMTHPSTIEEMSGGHGARAAHDAHAAMPINIISEAAKANKTAHNLNKHGMLLLQYLDPPLLVHGNHLGTPVRTRIEARVHGLVQWEPLRIWVSHYGFVRGGTPWHNYSADVSNTFSTSNASIWAPNHGMATCAPKPPRDPPPWVERSVYAEQLKAKSCVCQTVSDVIDQQHDEVGFASSGTLRRLDHAASSAGIAPESVWRGIDEVLTREMIIEQRKFQDSSSNRSLSRWATVFSSDLGFAADGHAYIYETSLLPSWKQPGFQSTEAVDREKLGIYSALLLAMGPLLVDPGADVHHKHLLSDIHLPQRTRLEVLDFMRSQGLASALGMHRVWPSLHHQSSDHSLDDLADVRDVSFSRLLRRHKLLMSSRSLPAERRSTDVWGGPSANPAERGIPMWPVGNGMLYGDTYRKHKCIDTPRILKWWVAQEEERKAAGKRVGCTKPDAIRNLTSQSNDPHHCPRQLSSNGRA